MAYKPIKVQAVTRGSTADPRVLIDKIGAEIFPLSEEAREADDFIGAVEALQFFVPRTRVSEAFDLKRILQVVVRAPLNDSNGDAVYRTYDVKRIVTENNRVILSAARS